MKLSTYNYDEEGYFDPIQWITENLPPSDNWEEACSLAIRASYFINAVDAWKHLIGTDPEFLKELEKAGEEYLTKALELNES